MWKERFEEEIKEIEEETGMKPIKVKCGHFYSIASVVRIFNKMKEKQNETEKTEE